MAWEKVFPCARIPPLLGGLNLRSGGGPGAPSAVPKTSSVEGETQVSYLSVRSGLQRHGRVRPLPARP